MLAGEQKCRNASKGRVRSDAVWEDESEGRRVADVVEVDGESV